MPLTKVEEETIVRRISDHLAEIVAKELSKKTNSEIEKGIRTGFLTLMNAYDPQYGSWFNKIVAEGLFDRAVTIGIENHLKSIDWKPKESKANQ